MEFLIISIIVLILVFTLKYIFNINLKIIKEIVENKELDMITKRYPENKEICKWCLKKLENNSVLIEENESKESCLYIALTNKILIANIKDSYTRIQTIAHECLHSIQERRMLNFNFIFSNIYLLYFIIISILAILGIFQTFWMMFLVILLIIGMTHLLIRNYLENDAMIKAKYLAKEYMEDVKISTQEEINKIITQYDKINPFGIKSTNYYLFFNVCKKIVIFSLICFIRIVAF